MIAFVIACLVTATPSPTATSFSPAMQQALTAAVDDVIADTPMTSAAGFTMAVRHHGKIWHLDRGVVNAKTKQPTTSTTSFRLASITKTFTAIAVMQLAQDGQLDLDAPVRTIVTTLPPSLSAITVRHLLNHTSGIHHYPVRGPERAWHKHLTTSQTLAVFQSRPLAATPGQSFLYTTYGYDVLGAVLEAQTGSAYADVVDDRIFAPLGMTDTFIEDTRKRRADWPIGLKQTRAGVVVAGDLIDVSSRFAGGGARGTVDDLLRYGEALLAGHLVDDGTWQQMIKPTFSADGLQNDYGLGFAVYPQRGHLVIAHAGGQPETTSLLYLIPAEELVVVMLTNLEGQGDVHGEVAAAVTEVLVEDGQTRRAVYATDVVDSVIADGENRAFSHGRAFVDQVAADISVDPAAIDAAFSRFAVLTDPARIAADPIAARTALREAHHPKNGRVLVLVGATIAKALREASASSWALLPKRGPLAFFDDYAALCAQQPPVCPPSRRLPQPLIARTTKLLMSWTSPSSSTASSWRRGDLVDIERVRPVLLSLLALPARPDLHDDLVVVADRLQAAGRVADAETLRAVDVQLHPRQFALETKTAP